MRYLVLASILAVYGFVFTPGVVAQTELPFLGTWKIDTTWMKQELEAAKAPEAAIKQRLAIMDQQRWVFGSDGQATTITHGVPSARTWKLTKSEETYEIEFVRGEIVEKAVVTMDGQKRMALASLIDGSPKFAMKFVWVSDQQTVVKPRALEIGSKAPVIDLQHQYGAPSKANDAEFSGRFEAGHVYLIEFWGTWCPPCIGAMPELAQLQNEFRDQKVHVILVSNETDETVTEFLATAIPKEMKIADAKTFGELTKELLVAADPDGSTVRDYVGASNQKALPALFVVGKSGEIEWMGVGAKQPVSKVLKQIVEDAWDRPKFAKEFSEQRKMQADREAKPRASK